MTERLTAQDVIRLLQSANEVESVTTKATKDDGTRGTAHVTLRNGQRFYIAINTERGIDAP